MFIQHTSWCIMFKTYFSLTKPGIIFGNVVTTLAGFFLASKGHVNMLLLAETLTGISFVIASACVFNNYIDRGIDVKMTRTKNRALASNVISARYALIYAIMLGLLGFYLLTIYTNMLTVLLGFLAFFDYIVLYGIAKRKSIHGTLIGSISGSIPPVAGYTAVSNHLDMASLLLFAILTTWQMPHFYAIAIYRLHDYAAAGLPVLPVKQGIAKTKIHMLVYLIAFIIVSLLLTFMRFTGYLYFFVALVLGVAWLGLGMRGFGTKHDTAWARHMFVFSLITISLLSITIMLNTIPSR